LEKLALSPAVRRTLTNTTIDFYFITAIRANYMRLIEFKAVDNYGNEYLIFINPEHIESIYTITNKSRIGINLVSGNPVEVNHTLEEVIKKLSIDITSSDYKRTARDH
jgi:uncharacterized protein YlzI (FlbEa/FlbD family)